MTQGDLLEVFVQGYYHRVPRSRGNRRVSIFSAKARLALIKFSQTIDWKATKISLYMTFTYPPECEKRDRRRLNTDRYLILRHIEKELCRQVGGIWRIEWKPRLSGPTKGELAPHWHFVLFDVGFISYKKIRAFWEALIGAKRRTQMRFDRIYDGEQATKYIAKYAAKIEPGIKLDSILQLNSQGRHYGYPRKGLIPRRPVTWSANLTQAQFEALGAIARARVPNLDPSQRKGFTLFGKYKDEAMAKILELGLPMAGASG